MSGPAKINAFTPRTVTAELTDIMPIGDPTTGITNKIPLSLLPFVNTPGGSNLTLAACAIRPSITDGVVTWNFIDDSGHTPIFFTGIEQSPAASGRIRLTYPTVTSISTFLVVPDETFATVITGVGATVDVDNADIQLAYVNSNDTFPFVGNGTTWVSFAALPDDWQITGGSINVGSAPGGCGGDFNGSTAYYTGTNNYGVRKRSSGLGIYNAGFDLWDFGTSGVATPTSSDYLTINLGGTCISSLNAYDPNQAVLGESFANLWVIALYEL